MPTFLRTTLLLLTFLSATALAEEPSALNWVKIDTSYFEFFTPTDFKKVAINGEDSYAGKYQSRTITLEFDYGLYSNSLSKPDGAHELIERSEVIHGHKAKIVTYTKSNTEFVIAIHFPQGGRPYKSGNGLTIISICRSKADYEVVQKIYSSIKFIK